MYLILIIGIMIVSLVVQQSEKQVQKVFESWFTNWAFRKRSSRVNVTRQWYL